MAELSFQPIVLVHGGAGDIPDSRVPAKLDGVRRAARRGYEVLQQSGSVLDAIVAAVELMEDEPAFNAGKGSVLTLEGEIEMEALICEGKNLKSGAVTLVKNIAHPISLARRVMEETPHAFLGGVAVNEFAARQGVPKVSDDYLMTPAAKSALDHFKRAKCAPSKMEIGESGVGTVGSVAIDAGGHTASATSTGGITGKYNGRIGDTPLLGCGGYADDERGTVSTTGHGETIMRYNLAQQILCDIASGKSAQEATKDQCESMTKRLNNTAGAITISHTGDVGVYFTSKRMAWAYQLGDELHYGIEHGQHLVDKAKVDPKSCIKLTSLEESAPLAEQMRPASLDDYIGQSHVLGHATILRTLLARNEIPSMILWGPPGCGKTSLAHVISKQCQSKSKQQFRFVKLSATMAGVNDVKEAVKVAKNELASFKRRTILFMDEIHRFNKLQQDIFLPHVESGCIILIGATTENPSFSLNSALLSRCRVFVLEKLATEDIISILTSAARRLDLSVVSEGKDSSNSQLSIEQESLEWLAGMCDGDARIALNSLHLALKTYTHSSKPVRITLRDIQEGIKRSHLLYDRKGEEHYNIISALHKSIRASDENAALYWLARMLEGGEDPIYIARRLVVCASEDIGMKDPHALTMAMSAMQACQQIGMPECGLFLAHISTYLARAPKSREVYDALNAAKQCVRDHKGALPAVPLHLRNAPTKLMKQLGYGAGYNMRDRSSSNLTYMPEGMEDMNFFGRKTS